MALTQPQRIEISKKIVSIPKENESMEKSKVLQQAALTKAQEVDSGNKSILDLREPVINGYQAELQMLDGNGRSVTTEALIQDAANRVIGNFFFYNQVGVATPSVPDGVWKNFYPFLLGYGIGKNYFEVYPTVQKEQDLIDAFQSAVTALEVFHPMERCTGQNATVGMPPPDVIAAYPAVQAALTAVITAVSNYNTFLTTQSSIIYTTDYDTSRQPTSLVAKSNIDTIIKPAIATWTAYNNYNTAHGQTTFAGFYAYNTALLQPTKGNPIQLGILKTAVIARKTFVDSIRIPQLTGYLGTVSQNLSDGSIISQSGLYGERSLGLNLRLGVMTGSLTKVVGLTKGQQAQQNIIDSNTSNLSAYDLIIKVSKFKAPASANNIVHVVDSSAFVVGNTVFVCGDGQEELTGTILAINGSRIDLDFEVPKKYTPMNNSRLYKTI